VAQCKAKVSELHALFARFGMPLRLAFVGYRDFGDEAYVPAGVPALEAAPWLHKVMPFTATSDDAAAFMAGVFTGGAALDVPEDVEGGLRLAAGLEWSSSIRILIHFADAPVRAVLLV